MCKTIDAGDVAALVRQTPTMKADADAVRALYEIAASVERRHSLAARKIQAAAEIILRHGEWEIAGAQHGFALAVATMNAIPPD